jgi:putative ABC transport system permease protein
MKYLTYIFRNARRNPVRSLLTIASTSICLFLMMILLSFFEINNEVNTATRIYNRIATLNANGFAGLIPIAAVKQVAQMDGVVAATPFSWIGGKYLEETVPFAQFGVDADTVFSILDEFTIPPDELKAFQQNRDGCVIGRKLAQDKNLKVGDSLPIKGDAYPVDLNLVVRGIYDGPNNRDLRMCLVRWDYFDELLKRAVMTSSSGGSLAPASARISGNAGMIYTKCKSATDSTATATSPPAPKPKRLLGRCSPR